MFVERYQRHRVGSWLAFFGCWLAIAVVWLWLLPELTVHPIMQQRIERHRDAGINAGAMVYTELGAVKGVKLRYQDGRPVLTEFLLNGQ